MSRVFRALALCVLFAAAGRGADAQEHPAQRADRARFDAMIKADTAALTDLLSADLTYVHSSGVLETRDEYVEAIRSGKYKYKKVDLEDVKVRAYGDTALVSGKATIDVNSGGNDVHTVLRFLEVWVKQDGKWRMSAWQSTRLNP
jgi:ketosteroid isomerase-like protein